MNPEIIKSMMNPLRLKIVQEISLKGTATTKEIAAVCGDIPQATLYRHLNALLKNGVIEIVSENKVRGILEKVYGIKSNLSKDMSSNPSDLDKDEISQLFSQFIISLLNDFEHYLSIRENVDIVKDQVGFRSYSLYLSDEELTEMMQEIYATVRKRLDNQPSQERTLRKFSTVLTPYKQERNDKNEK